jgi:hypothetical protein
MNKYLPLIKWIRFSAVCLFWSGMGLGMAEMMGILDGPGFGFTDPVVKLFLQFSVLFPIPIYLLTRILPLFLKLKVPSSKLTLLMIPILWIGGFIFVGKPLLFRDWRLACETETNGLGCYGYGITQKEKSSQLHWYKKGMKLGDGMSYYYAAKVDPEKYQAVACDFHVKSCTDRSNISRAQSRFCIYIADNCKK